MVPRKNYLEKSTVENSPKRSFINDMGMWLRGDPFLESPENADFEDGIADRKIETRGSQPGGPGTCRFGTGLSEAAATIRMQVGALQFR